jgi:hypothetical protein
MSAAANTALCNATRSAKAASRKAKTAWNAAPPFPIADKPGNWSAAIAAACAAASSLGAAQALAWHGVPVFPVNSGDKRPLSEHGVYSATTDLEQIARWWRRKTEAQIAVPMGRRTGVLAIDADAKPPHAYDGIGAWRALEAEHGTAPTPHPPDGKRRAASHLPLALRSADRLPHEGTARGHRVQGRRRRNCFPTVAAQRQALYRRQG